MLKFFVCFFVLICFTLESYSQEYYYVLEDFCIKDLYSKAMNDISLSGITVIKDPYGIIMRIDINKNFSFDEEIVNKIYKIKYFLAKIKNPVIIEVHVGRDFENKFKNYKRWEFSTVIANKIEKMILDSKKGLDRQRLKSVGYGEFFPPRNTSNNGGNFQNRIDIIVLCNVIGE